MSEVRALYRPPVEAAARAKVAQLVELTTENRAVGSSSLPLGTTHSDYGRPRPPRLSWFRPFHNRQFRTLSPLVPGTIVVRPGVVANSIQGKQDARRRHASIAVGNDWYTTPYTTILEQFSQLHVRLPGAVIVDERLRPNVDGGWHMTAPSAPSDSSCVLCRVPGID